MSEQDGINYDALAKAHYVAGKQLFGMTEDVLWGGATEHAKQQSRYKARAVIASYLDQRAARGFVELRLGDEIHATIYQVLRDKTGMGWDELHRVARAITTAILAAHARGATDGDKRRDAAACPICGVPLVWEGEVTGKVVCRNPECAGFGYHVDPPYDDAADDEPA